MYESQIKNLKKLWLPDWERCFGRAGITASNNSLSYISYSIDYTWLNIWRKSVDLDRTWSSCAVSVKLVR